VWSRAATRDDEQQDRAEQTEPVAHTGDYNLETAKRSQGRLEFVWLSQEWYTFFSRAKAWRLSPFEKARLNSRWGLPE
jgi:hypothetical protein